METVTVEMLYKSFGVLADAKDKASEHVDCYETILKGVEGNVASKRLTAQFISRFFKHFKTKSEAALNAIMDLCEDEDISVRRAAIKEIPSICKSDLLQVPRLSDVLVQLTQTEDSNELSAVTTALVSLFELDAKGTLKGLFSQIQQGDEVIRERAINFLCNKLKTFSENVLTKELEEYILVETKKIMEDVSGDEFHQLIKVISSLSHLQTFQGRQQILNIIIAKIDEGEKFNASDEDSVGKIIQCMTIAQPLYSKNVHSSLLLKYVCENIIPALSEIQVDAENVDDRRLQIIKLTAEMSTFLGDGSKVKDCMEPLFTALIEYMPLPPEDGGEVSESGDPKLNFSYVECLLFTFYQISSKHPDFLTSDEAADRLKDFRKRLQYFARGLAVYIKQLRMTLQGQTRDQLKSEPQSKLKVTALKLCNNINALVRDLFHNPPSYKSSINLSWKTATPEIGVKPQKRPSTGSATNGEQKKTAKGERALYRTPGGKYSTGLAGASGRGRGFKKRGGKF